MRPGVWTSKGPLDTNRVNCLETVHMPKAILTAKYGARQGIPIFFPCSIRGRLTAVNDSQIQVHAMLTFGRPAPGVKTSISTQVIITTIMWGGGGEGHNFAIIPASVHVGSVGFCWCLIFKRAKVLPLQKKKNLLRK